VKAQSSPGSTPTPGSASPSPATLVTLDTRRVTVPLRRSWGPGVPAITVIEAHVVDTDGAEGWGFSWTPSIGAASVDAMLRHDIRDWVLGRPADARAVWQPLWEHLHEAGSGGVTTIAMAGLDTALWDLAARRQGLPIEALLGERRTSVAAYGSGVNLHSTTDELLTQVEGWIAAGFDAVKIKVGSPDLARDVERVREVRRLLGDRGLMIDANQRWSRDAALSAMRRLADFGPAWIEEPLRADDLDGYRELQAAIPVPVACGENLHTRYRFGEFARAGGARILQPNVIRVGGITPLLGIVDDAVAEGVDVALHLLPEISGRLALALPVETAAEVVDGALFDDCAALDGPSPIAVAAGRLTSTGTAGLGLRFVDPAESRPEGAR
jgi:L-alanine-DL-glutamate epimerase-like enolase superfamily enzyme